MSTTREAPAWIKPAVDYLPLAAFFLVYLTWGLYAATGALIVVTLVATAVAWALERRLPALPLLTAVVVTVFGGLTLMLQDETFIKMKPTIVQLLFTAILLGGLAFKRPLLKYVLGRTLAMDETGWRRLTVRWAVFFAAMGALNEIVWRTQSTDFWVTFKVFGILGLTLVFALAQAPLVMKHQLRDEEVGEKGGAA